MNLIFVDKFTENNCLFQLGSYPLYVTYRLYITPVVKCTE